MKGKTEVMDTFNKHISKEKKRIYWLPLVIILLLIAAIVWVVYHFKDEKRFAVVKFFGKGSAMNLSKNYNFTEFYSGNNSKGALLAEEGDLLAINKMFIHFTNVKNDSLQADDTGDSLYFVNGKINSIIISDRENLLPWFGKMKVEDISNLETISFTSIIPESYIPYLKEIARLRPHTSLAFEEDDSLNIIDTYLKQANFFTPRFVKASITSKQLPLLARFKTAECIYLELMDSVVSTSLPAMPALKQCILYSDEIKTIDASFFSNNKQLEKVALLVDINAYSLLQPLDNLQELSINNQEQGIDMAALKNKLSKLSVLIISGNYTNIDSLATYKKLRWLGLPENTSQQQFNTITAKLTGLQVLELQGSDSIINLTSLQQLPDLRGLVITDTVTDKQSLYALKELRYLSIPENNKEDSAYTFALQKALPGCIIVPNSGACLGSGWLLLLLPMVVLFIVLFKEKTVTKYTL